MPQKVAQNIPQTAGHAAARHIRDQIMAGVLAPGATLNQKDLALALGMSRIPIRDALRTLAAEGLVKIQAHATATVTGLSLDDLEELYELRLAIEPALCREALPNVGPMDITAMGETLELMETAEGSDWLNLNRAFHETLYMCADKPRTIEVIDQIRRATDRYTRIYQRFDRTKVQLEHRLIFEAVSDGHPRRVEALVAAHLADGYETMLRYVAYEEGSDSTATTR